MSKKGNLKPKSKQSPIFIHSLWRSGSTYIFNVFRMSKAAYFCYQEPIHEIAYIWKDNPEKLLQIDGDIVRPLRHPLLDRPYYYELFQTADSWRGVITKPIIYDQYFDSTCSEGLAAYISALIHSAKKRPVIQECRTSSRIGAIKEKFSGVHIYLWRNPWDQWWSYKSTNYFDLTTQLILNSANCPAVILKLRSEIHFEEMHFDEINDEIAYFDRHRLSAEDSYLAFYVLWLISMHEANNSADIQICIDTLSENYEYQKDILQKLSTYGVVGIDFSDCIASFSIFSEQDRLFFQRIEDRAHGLLLSSGYSQKTLNAILKKRFDAEASIQKSNEEKTICRLIESNARAHEIVLRQETENSSRISHLKKAIIDQREKVDWLEHEWNASKSSVQMLERALSDKAIEYEEQRIKIEEAFSNSKHAFEIQLNEANIKLSEVETKCEALIRLNHERELQLSGELFAVQKSAEQAKSNLLQAHNQQLIELQIEHQQRERNLQQLIEALNAEARTLEQHWQEKIITLQSELLNREYQWQIKSDMWHQEAHVQQSAAQKELLDLVQLSQQREQQLDAEKKASQQLQHLLRELQDELLNIRSGLSWRMTSPLRTVAEWFRYLLCKVNFP